MNLSVDKCATKGEQTPVDKAITFMFGFKINRNSAQHSRKLVL